MTDVLFSSNHGLLAWHPILYLAVLGIPLFWRRDFRMGSLLTLMFVAQIYINGAVATWWGGSAFGGRRFASCALLFALGLAALITWLKARPIAAVSVIMTPLVLFNLALVLDVRNGTLPAGSGVTFARMIERFGNPFSFPANAAFVWRHGGSATTYDRLGERMFNNIRLDIGGTADEPFLTRGWSERERTEQFTFRWAQTLESVIVVPLYGPRFVEPDEEQRLADYVLRIRVAPFQWAGAPVQEIDVE